MSGNNRTLLDVFVLFSPCFIEVDITHCLHSFCFPPFFMKVEITLFVCFYNLPCFLIAEEWATQEHFH